ncbi:MULTISPECIES: hypothetical protein [unclassified Xanthomonas]|uniref:hypothetical protein n=1 Tax=unclassified Xanthomonas TaxID=2643310 RepID=UPI002889499B|nr:MULTISPECIES: hypothetical protein [unclassified Xanthomonas]
MQRMISHATPLPLCRIGHTARHIHDQRSLQAGGGHLVECACSASSKHGAFDDALREWCRQQGRPTPKTNPQQQLPIDNVTRLRRTAR